MSDQPVSLVQENNISKEVARAARRYRRVRLTAEPYTGMVPYREGS